MVGGMPAHHADDATHVSAKKHSNTVAGMPAMFITNRIHVTQQQLVPGLQISFPKTRAQAEWLHLHGMVHQMTDLP